MQLTRKRENPIATMSRRTQAGANQIIDKKLPIRISISRLCGMSVANPDKHPLAIITGLSTYAEACGELGIEPEGSEAENLGFIPTTPEMTWTQKLFTWSWGLRDEEIRVLNSLWGNRLLEISSAMARA